MNIFGSINVVFGLLAISNGAIVVSGLLRGALGGKSTVRFLRDSLIASLGGLLPASHHLGSIQQICMLSVYCSGLVIVAWLKFRLAGRWRPAFALLNTAVLYLNAVSAAIWLSKNSHLFTPTIQSFPVFETLQLSLAAFFAVLGVLAVRSVMLERAELPGSHKVCMHIAN